MVIMTAKVPKRRLLLIVLLLIAAAVVLALCLHGAGGERKRPVPRHPHEFVVPAERARLLGRESPVGRLQIASPHHRMQNADR